MIEIKVNGKSLQTEASVDTPLLWVLRDHLKMTGTKYSCGEGLCGACTVLIDGKAVRSCVTTLEEVKGKRITTIEGLGKGHPVIKAWLSEEASQCGWCQPGQIMAAVSLLDEKPNPTDADIDAAMDGNICRCGTYQRIRTAIHTAAAAGKGGKP